MLRKIKKILLPVIIIIYCRCNGKITHLNRRPYYYKK